jgi:hypothetical protein
MPHQNACPRSLALQRRVVELLRYRPGDAYHRGAADILRDRRATDSDRSGDHPIARPTGILQAQNFSNLPRRQSLGGHRTREPQKQDLAPFRLPTTPPSHHPINGVAAFVRIGWPLSIGIGGRLPSESVAALPRIPQVIILANSIGANTLARRAWVQNSRLEFMISQALSEFFDQA